MPAVGLIAGGDVLGEGDVGVIFDGDLVVIPDDIEISELLMARQRGGLGRDALLEVAVGSDDPDCVVEGRLAGSGLWVHQPAEAALAVGEPDRSGEALAERPGRDLHAVGVAVLGVARSLGAPGAQGLDVLQLQAVAGEVQLQVQGQRGVAGREDEAVASDPRGILGVMPHDLLEEQIGGRGQRHRRAGVSCTRAVLDGVGGQHTQCVHSALVQLGEHGIVHGSFGH